MLPSHQQNLPSGMNPLDFQGMTVLVSGASSGIGRAVSVYLSHLGAKCVLAGRSIERLEATGAMMAPNADHMVAPFDLTQGDLIPGWMAELAAKVGPFHGLVHSAGMTMPKPLRFLVDQDFTKTMALNVGAALALTKGFQQPGVHQAPASIVFLSSVMGIIGRPGASAYGASKGALQALARSLALELAADGIRVNCVAPAMVKTEMMEDLKARLTQDQFDAELKAHPMGLIETDDVAAAVAFLLSKAARVITGVVLPVDGGYTAQ